MCNKLPTSYPGSLFFPAPAPGEEKKRDPGNEVAKLHHQLDVKKPWQDTYPNTWCIRVHSCDEGVKIVMQHVFIINQRVCQKESNFTSLMVFFVRDTVSSIAVYTGKPQSGVYPCATLRVRSFYLEINVRCFPWVLESVILATFVF